MLGYRRKSEAENLREFGSYTYIKYRGAGKFLARLTSRNILFDVENNSFVASLVIYIYIYIYIVLIFLHI